MSPQLSVPNVTPMESRHVPIVTTIAILAVCGYLTMGRGFAHVGVAPLGLFLGEMLLLASFAYRPSRDAYVSFALMLSRPGPFHILAWTTALFVAVGVGAALMGYFSGFGAIAVAKTASFTFYVAVLPLGIWLGRAVPNLLQRTISWIAWTNMLYGFAFIAFLDSSPVRLPTAGAPLGGPQASAASIVGILCIDRTPSKRWYLLAGNFFVLLAQQKRAEWIGFMMAMVIWTIVTRRLRLLAGATAAVVTMGILISVAGLSVAASDVRGGQVTPGGLLARVIAPFNEDLAAEFVPASEVKAFSGTVTWREQWWHGIWDQIHASQSRTLFGNGFGFPLRSLSPAANVDDDARTPHNIFYFTLGYMGWVGVMAYALFTGALLHIFWRIARATRDPFGLCFFAVCLGIGLFSNFFEAPFGAIPFYLIAGLVAAQAASPGRLIAAPTRSTRLTTAISSPTHG